MSSRGQSLSMFVVQRTFRRVRRGYDPAEVDRHLELVSQWFTSTDAGRALAEERARLHEREAEAHRLLEGARREGEATIEGARLRAQADGREAERMLAEAEEIRSAARVEAAAAEAIREAEAQGAAPAARPSSCSSRCARRRARRLRRCVPGRRRSCGRTRTAGAARPIGSCR